MDRINVSANALALAMREARPMDYKARPNREGGKWSDSAGWEYCVVSLADSLEYAAHGSFDRAAFYEAAGFLDLFPG